ncbi:MAG: FAD-dependent thymidylate synthase [Candidatus Omnitrophota bacterium]
MIYSRMGQTTLKVQLQQKTENAVELVYAACRQCYSSEFAGDIFAKGSDSFEKKEAFVRKIVASVHESPLEHVKFTFAVKGVSRALSTKTLSPTA